MVVGGWSCDVCWLLLICCLCCPFRFAVVCGIVLCLLCWVVFSTVRLIVLVVYLDMCGFCCS